MTERPRPERLRFYRGSLALRVLIISIVVIALPLLVYFVFVYHQEYSSRLREISVRLHDLGKSRAEKLSQMTRYNMQIIDIIQQVIDDGEFTGGEDSEQLSRFLEDVAIGGHLASAYYISIEPGPRYIGTASSDPSLVGQDFSADRYIENVLVQGQVSFLAHGASLNEGTDSFEKYFYVAKLVYDTHLHRPRGIITVSTAVDELIKRLVAPERSPYQVTFSLVTGDGIVFASSDPNLVLQVVPPMTDASRHELERARQMPPGTLRPGEITLREIEEIPGSVYLTWGGREQVAVEVPIGGTDLSLLLTADERTIFQEQRARLWRVLGVFILIFAVGGWAALWLTLRMSRPWQQLCEVMNRVSKGDLTARYHKRRSGFEINIVGAIFNQTINSLREQMARAEAERVQKETLDQEFRIGREIQMSILPTKPPVFSGVSLAARYVPAKQVGGDFYDVFPLMRGGEGTSELVLTVADASGKGISACLYSLLLRSMLRSFAVTSSRVSDIMLQANNLFCQDTGATGMFVTVLSAIYHPSSKELSFTSCGHPPALIRRSNGALEALVGQGLAVGVTTFTELPQDTVSLDRGDLLVLYTDGITEAHNVKNELFGDQRLSNYLAQEGHRGVDEVADGILAQVAAFRGTAPQFDDMTLLLMRVD